MPGRRKLAKQQQQIVSTVLKANSDYLDGMENKLLGSAVAKLKRQNQTEQQMFLDGLQKRLVLFGSAFLAVQVVLLGIFLFMK